MTSCWMQAIPSGGRPSASVRALHTATIRSWRSGARSATGISRGAGASTTLATPRSTATAPSVMLGERLAPDRQHRVGRDHGVAQVARLVAVEAARLDAVGGVGEVEVAWHPQQRVARDRGAGAVAAERDVGLDRREVAAAVEDQRQLVAQREAVDPHRHRGRARLVEQRAPEKLLCRGSPSRGARSWLSLHRRVGVMIVIGSVAGI